MTRFRHWWVPYSVTSGHFFSVLHCSHHRYPLLDCGSNSVWNTTLILLHELHTLIMSSVTLCATQKDRALEASSTSDIKTLDSILSTQGELAGEEDDNLISLFMAEAIRTGQSKSLGYLLVRCSELPKEQHSLVLMHDSIFRCKAGFPVHKMLVQRYPFLEETDFGERADHLGYAAMSTTWNSQPTY
jgi:hypothetical protein